MAQITRWTASRELYDPEYGDRMMFCELDEDETGDYVRYDDHVAALKAKDAEIEELAAQLAEMTEECRKASEGE